MLQRREGATAMVDEVGLAQPEAPLPAANVNPASGFWTRVHEHKIIQWGVGYLGAALALTHGQELVGEAFEWPHVVTRVVIISLIVGFPIALTLAWYHGHRGLKQMSAGELAIVSVLLLIGAVFFTAALPSADEHSEAGAGESASSDSGPAAVSTTAPAQPPTAARPVLANSVAVLPLDNLSGEAESALYARGMHSEIINQLGKLSNVVVIGRDSVMQYETNRPQPPQIAAELGAQSLLSGTFQLTSGQVRIVVELVDPKTETRLWGEAYQGPFADILSVQSDISMNVANALAVEFSAAEQAAIETPPTSSAEAYALYLQAWDVVSRGQVQPAQELLDRALALDPQFASAYGSKAALLAVGMINTEQSALDAAERAALERQVREYANRALELDPREPRARSALRQMDLLTWRWSAYASAIAPRDEPNLAPLEVWAVAWMGRPAEAVRIGQRWVDRDPRNPAAYWVLGVVQGYAGDRLGSTQTLLRASQMAPSRVVFRARMAQNHVALGNTADAAAELQLVERLSGEIRSVVLLPELAYSYARLGRHDDAERIFQEMQALGGSDLGDGAWATACWAIGDKKCALEALDALAEKIRNHEIDPGFINAMNLKMNFLADPALEEPEIANALARIAGD